MSLINLDLDGVFADFMQAQHNAHGIDYNISEYPYPLGLWDMFSYDGCPMTWESANTHSDENFWTSMPWMYDGVLMWNAIKKEIHLEDAQILTCPMMNEESYTGKAKWVRQNMKKLYTRTTISKVPKWESIGKDHERLLIDDSNSNVDQWRCAGGYAILVPRPWNSNHNIPLTSAVDYVIEQLREWKRSFGYVVPYGIHGKEIGK